jgi:uncharacterized protein
MVGVGDHSGDEDRWVTIGRDLSENVLVVIHTFQKEDADTAIIRVISARRATKKEIKQMRVTSHEKGI